MGRLPLLLLLLAARASAWRLPPELLRAASASGSVPLSSSPSDSFGVAAAADAAPRRSDTLLNVHIVPHTHDDVGWLKTVDQYYLGANNSIQFAGVQYILDSVVDHLLADARKRFTYVEVAFFSRWWRAQRAPRRRAVASLVAQGRLTFANGGWCMHDEAATSFSDMIDQTTLGHTWLAENLNATARVGWQIDPFGHSALQASLLGPAVGFQGVFLGRAHYADLQRRIRERALEFRWRPGHVADEVAGEADDAQPAAAPFVGLILGSGNYGPPPGFDWDVSRDPPICDDPLLEGFNAPAVVDAFVNTTLEWAQRFRGAGGGGDVMFTMGSDFNYQAAGMWFSNLDKLIALLNADGRVNALYSTPEAYLAAKMGTNWGAGGLQSDNALPVRSDDMFPYADARHSYWTGYYASRPALKGMVRGASGVLAAARQLSAFGRGGAAGGVPPAIAQLEDALATAQHHDAVAGTSKQHVADDYALRLHNGVAAATRGAVRDATALLARAATAADVPTQAATARRQLRGSSGGGSSDSAHYDDEVAAVGFAKTLLDDAALGGGFAHCPLLNVSLCGATEALRAAGDAVTLFLWNPLGWATLVPIRVPIGAAATVAVRGPGGAAVAAQALPASSATRRLRALHRDPPAAGDADASEPLELIFMAGLPAAGYALYRLEAVGTAAEAPLTQFTPEQPLRSTDDVAEAQTTLRADVAGTGLHLDADGQLSALSQGALRVASTAAFVLYDERDDSPSADYSDEPEDDDGSGAQAGGAYIFRPLRATSAPLACRSLVRGLVLTEARCTGSGELGGEWASVAVQLHAGASPPHAALEWTVGPVPVGVAVGRSVTLRIGTGIASGGVFWSDANGRDLQRRVRGAWPAADASGVISEPTASAFVPITALATLNDAAAALALLPDRAQGAASLNDGELETMLHRRLLFDDARGVAEALNETETRCAGGGGVCATFGLTVRGVTRLAVAEPGALAAPARRLQAQAERPPLALFAVSTKGGKKGAPPPPPLPPARSLLAAPLPPAVALLTLAPLPRRALLLRLAHGFELRGPGADAALSRHVTLDLAALFPPGGPLGHVSAVTELLLSAAAARPATSFPRDGAACEDIVAAETAPPRRCRGGPVRAAPAASGASAGGSAGSGGSAAAVSFRVSLGPMEVRAFRLEMDDEEVAGGGDAWDQLGWR